MALHHAADGAGAPRGRPDADPVVEVYKAGTDRTLIRENLRRSVAERLANLVALRRFAAEVRRAGAAARRRRASR